MKGINGNNKIELVVFIEDIFGFEVADEEIIPDNLDSIAKVVEFVNKRLGDAA